ncbi:hypothetical protein SAMN04488510_10495 [Fervidobacterium changbaicum]|uniref:Xylose isomerase-like TIM barrel domain-containing protein n=1 Tax=Fervidobacterium islandicum TaxID=2423 RepID=A0AAI8GE77_FERIS|nr:MULTISPECIES: cobamide remodeling phosphodiesterase CbiR [Fervidobacterium]AMW33783.2 hypothetical protein NA23_08430 [Fervidobacterium islandicum]SDH08655.1 hypothetical protein SAMN04488510_10495 [Fervidobacterium changbaicum]
MHTNLEKQLIGTTSWIIPGTYYENVEYITRNFRTIQFVELLVYTWDEDTFNLLEKEKDYLFEIARQTGIKYTAHLPTDSLSNVFEAFKYLENNFEIENYVVHPFEEFDTGDFESKELQLLLNHPKISVENLKEHYFKHSRTVFDTGHCFLGIPVDQEFLNNVVEIHMMGVNGDKDHEVLDFATLEKVHELLSDTLFKTRYLCFEIFDAEKLEESLKIWNEFKDNRWGV